MSLYIFYFLLWYALSEGGPRGELRRPAIRGQAQLPPQGRPCGETHRGRQRGAALLLSSCHLFLQPFICTLGLTWLYQLARLQKLSFVGLVGLIKRSPLPQGDVVPLHFRAYADTLCKRHAQHGHLSSSPHKPERCSLPVVSMSLDADVQYFPSLPAATKHRGCLKLRFHCFQ